MTFYRKAYKKVAAEGSLDDLRIGDYVSYRDAHNRTVLSTVEAVDREARRLTVAPSTHDGEVLRPGRTMGFDEVEKAGRA